jgi:hypothetical protein
MIFLKSFLKTFKEAGGVRLTLPPPPPERDFPLLVLRSLFLQNIKAGNKAED